MSFHVYLGEDKSLHHPFKALTLHPCPVGLPEVLTVVQVGAPHAFAGA